ncbi:hypothetical protein ERX37_03700 [Macrococcus hajekii]|uniref:Uncharacterized protein n=1 Tax=Macrococcus hajekii TaxID=198482 RepID=A0A4R6BN45_9STAP|nr:hypothetical protein [Macrococcus hajekii]TDM03201.1 hypothetical protein ERX37_03700 [Macrococcus hajekii]GGA96828.1 hypothetical protein GCM10007190_01080 [Macrococcus hajekii]
MTQYKHTFYSIISFLMAAILTFSNEIIAYRLQSTLASFTTHVMLFFITLLILLLAIYFAYQAFVRRRDTFNISFLSIIGLMSIMALLFNILIIGINWKK